MNAADVLVIILIAAALALAVGLSVRRKKRGSSCCGECANCRQSCPEEKHGPDGRI